MLALLLLCVLFAVPVTSQNLDFPHAIDISVPATLANFQCLQKNNSAVFVRVYKSDGEGAYDPVGAQNVMNAFKVGMNIEAFMVPQPKSTKSAAAQVEELMDGLKRDGVNPRHLWIHVTNPTSWPTNATTNVVWIQSLLDTVRSYNVGAGIFTVHMDWEKITLMTDMASFHSLNLWYYSVHGNGEKNESYQNFFDYYPFSGWVTAHVKRYGQNENVCGVMVNKNIINTFGNPLKSTLMRSERGMINVGGNFQ